MSVDTKLAKSFMLSAVPDSTGEWSIEVKAEAIDAAFAGLHRMVNDSDMPLARYWYGKAAGAGHPSAQNNLGFL